MAPAADKTREDLIAEVESLRQRVGELELAQEGLELAQIALAESEEKFRTLAEKSPNMIFINHQGGKVVYANELCTEILGFCREEFYADGFDYMCMVAPDSIEPARAAYEKHMKGEDVVPSEYRLKTKDGRTIETIVTTKLIPYDGDVAILGIVTDMTERKRAEESLRESEQRYREIFEQAADSIILVDAGTGAIAAFNDTACRNAGYTREEFVRLKRHEYDVEHDDEDLPDHIAMILRKGSDCFDTRIRTRNGELRDAHVSAKAVSIRGHDYIQCIIRDVTDQKIAEKELRANFTRLQKVLEGTVSGLAEMVEKKDPYTAGHQRQVSYLCRLIAEEMRLPREQITGVRFAGLLHDIGKIAIPTEIITKPGRLTENEFKLVQTHCRTAHDILRRIEFPWPVARMVLEHHERIDGSGYPCGLTRNLVLLESMILAVADVVDAMSSRRPYREALSRKVIEEELVSKRDVLYEPVVVNACMRLIHLGRIDIR